MQDEPPTAPAATPSAPAPAPAPAPARPLRAGRPVVLPAIVVDSTPPTAGGVVKLERDGTVEFTCGDEGRRLPRLVSVLYFATAREVGEFAAKVRPSMAPSALATPEAAIVATVAVGPAGRYEARPDIDDGCWFPVIVPWY